MSPPSLPRAVGTSAGELGRAGDGEIDLMLLFYILWNVSLEQPQRPLSEFIHWPVFSIRDAYMTGFLVNLLWFSRNYLNLGLLISLVMTFFVPPCAVVVALSSCMHFLKRRADSSTSSSSVSAKGTSVERESVHGKLFLLLLVLQVLCCFFTWRFYGFYSVVVCVSSIAIPIIAHALFTPYTDDAFDFYCSVLRRQKLPVPTPKSPTHKFSTMNPAFDMLCSEEGVFFEPLPERGYIKNLSIPIRNSTTRNVKKLHELPEILCHEGNVMMDSGLRRCCSYSRQSGDELCSVR